MALCSYCRGIKKGQTLPSNCGKSKESVHTKNIKEHFLKEISTWAYLPIGMHIEMHPRVITPTGQYGNCEKKFSHSHKSTRIHTHSRSHSRLHAFTSPSRFYKQKRNGKEAAQHESDRKACKIEAKWRETLQTETEFWIFEYDVQLQALKQSCKLRWMTREEKRMYVWVCVSHNLRDVYGWTA